MCLAVDADYPDTHIVHSDVYLCFLYTGQCFKDAIRAAVAYKSNSTDFMDEVMRELEVSLLLCVTRIRGELTIVCDENQR